MLLYGKNCMETMPKDIHGWRCLKRGVLMQADEKYVGCSEDDSSLIETKRVLTQAIRDRMSDFLPLPQKVTDNAAARVGLPW